jgi:predicted transcriptional regulator
LIAASSSVPLDARTLLALHIVFVAKRDELLALDARRRVYDYVRLYPGLHLSEIARGCGMETNHAKYHLLYLEKHGLLSSRRDEGYLRFFPKEEGSVGLREILAPDEKAVLALLRQPVPLHTILLLIERGEASAEELRAAVGVSHSTLLYHMGKLEQRGIATSDRAGRERRFRLVDPARIAQQVVRFRPPDQLVQGFLEAFEQLDL